MKAQKGDAHRYISGVHFQKCSNFSVTRIFTLKIGTIFLVPFFFTSKGSPGASVPLNTPMAICAYGYSKYIVYAFWRFLGNYSEHSYQRSL